MHGGHQKCIQNLVIIYEGKRSPERPIHTQEDLSEIRVGCQHVDRVQVPQNVLSAGGNKWSI
jgi:hypothetical protein